MTNPKTLFGLLFFGIGIGCWLAALVKNDPLWLIGGGLFAIAGATAL